MNDLTNLAKVTDQWENATSLAALVIPGSGGSRGAGAGEGGTSPRVQAALDKFSEAKAIRTGASTGKNGSTPLGGMLRRGCLIVIRLKRLSQIKRQEETLFPMMVLNL